MKATIVRLLTLTPALALAGIYGRTTGDVENALAVIAVLVGMWIGVQFGHRHTRTEG